jgi:hypothetical protein
MASISNLSKLLASMPSPSDLTTIRKVDIFSHRTPADLEAAIFSTLMIAGCADGASFTSCAPGATVSTEVLAALRAHNAGAPTYPTFSTNLTLNSRRRHPARQHVAPPVSLYSVRTRSLRRIPSLTTLHPRSRSHGTRHNNTTSSPRTPLSYASCSPTLEPSTEHSHAQPKQ